LSTFVSKTVCKSVCDDKVPVIEPHVPPDVFINTFPEPSKDVPLTVLIFVPLTNFGCNPDKS
jgi:hypothetical protein